MPLFVVQKVNLVNDDKMDKIDVLVAGIRVCGFARNDVPRFGRCDNDLSLGNLLLRHL